MKKLGILVILLGLFSIISCEKKESTDFNNADNKNIGKSNKPFGYVLLDGTVIMGI